MRQIENLRTESGDRPLKDVQIADCGQLEGDAALAADVAAADAYGDAYEDFPEDVPGGGALDAARVAKIAVDCKGYGTAAFKAGDTAAALEKYQKALRYLNEEPDLDGAAADVVAELAALRVSLNLNAALMNLKLQAWDDAARAAAAALAAKGIKPADQAKALYRRGLARVQLRDEEEALADLEAAIKLAPGDAAIQAELTKVKKKVSERSAKERAAYKKFFA